ncbi:integrase [Gossypium australe]|uniref:Integrase n=1 Tax=Gossypium australe TaxID=47621 RepID=A0A5B6VAQ1_9ROSI|nr:integrase [Gossypium australe]
MNADLTVERDGAELIVKPVFLSKIPELQKNDSYLFLKLEIVKVLYVPNDSELKQELLNEAHNSVYSIHPGNTKMYNGMKQRY